MEEAFEGRHWHEEGANTDLGTWESQDSPGLAKMLSRYESVCSLEAV